MRHTSTFTITFGDCDPAGIVFYPNMFRWMDATFHEMLKKFGGHAILCKRTGAKGLGLAQASANFRAPMTDGDILDVTLSIEKWSDKSLTIRYEGRVGDRLTFEAQEVRCLFKAGDKGIFAGSTDELKRILEDQTHGGC